MRFRALLPLRCLTNKTTGNLRCYVLRPSLPDCCLRSARGWWAPSVLARLHRRLHLCRGPHGQFVATVVSVDMPTREVVLSTPDGRQTTVVAGTNVTDLGRVNPGDRLTITFNDAIAVQMAMPGSPPVGTSASETAANGRRSINTAARVTIVSAATDGSSVTFTGPNGVTHTVDVQDPRMQAFVQHLKAGDQVDVAYTAEIAARLDPAP